MNEIISFNNEEFGNIRTVMIDNEPWFVAIDICKALDLSDTGKAVGRLDEDESTRIEIDHPQSPSKTIEVIIVNESGLYSLVLGSRKPEAKFFKRWITHEVIPSIRKTGRYEINKHDNQVTINRDDVSTLIQMNSKLIEQNQELLSIIKENIIDNKTSLHKNSPYNKIIETSDYPVSITVIANDYGISGRKLNSILLDLGIQNKNNGYWTLNDEYNNNDYTTTIIYTSKDGVDFPNTRWTKNGRKFIYDLLKRQNLLPICEK